MGGTIYVKSQLGKGSKFTFSIRNEKNNTPGVFFDDIHFEHPSLSSRSEANNPFSEPEKTELLTEVMKSESPQSTQVHFKKS